MTLKVILMRVFIRITKLNRYLTLVSQIGLIALEVLVQDTKLNDPKTKEDKKDPDQEVEQFAYVDSNVGDSNEKHMNSKVHSGEKLIDSDEELVKFEVDSDTESIKIEVDSDAESIKIEDGLDDDRVLKDMPANKKSKKDPMVNKCSHVFV